MQKFLFAILEHLPEVFGLEERFSATNAEFLHPRIREETQRALSLVHREEKVVRVGMKAKMTFVVADAMGEPVHRDGDESRLWRSGE